MVTIRVRFENGHFIPTEPLPPQVIEGAEYDLPVPPPLPTQEEIQAMLDRTRGMWADVADDIEQNIKESRQMWDEEWQKKLDSL